MTDRPPTDLPITDANEKLLSDAVDRNQPAVLSLPADGAVVHRKSRFLGFDESGGGSGSGAGGDGSGGDGSSGGESAGGAGRAIRVAPDDAYARDIDALIASGAAIAVSFKCGGQRVTFATTILRRQRDWLLIAAPTSVKLEQRRADCRVSIAAGETDLAVRVWRIDPRADARAKPPASAELSVEPLNLSLGGMGLRFLSRQRGELPAIAECDRLRIQLRFAEDELLLDGRVVHLPSPSELEAPATAIRGGVQFARLDADIKGRQKRATLARIIGLLQREEVRRARVGLLKSA